MDLKKSLFLLLLFFLSRSSVVYAQTASFGKALANEEYVCMPCGLGCDSVVHTKAGICTHCRMKLVEKRSVVFKNVTPAQLCEIVNSNLGVILLDVRTPEEFNGTSKVNSFGHLQNAINIPIQELENRINELEKYKDKEIIVYCSHSHRSPRACYLLTMSGFSNIKNMSGGMSTWQASVKASKGSELLFIGH
jgi:rhodanese-related sulfurtransferase